MVEKKKVCKECGRLNTNNKCICGSNSFLEKYKGQVIILNAKQSDIAKKLNILDNGEFALKY